MVCDFGIGWIALMLLYQQLKVRQKKGYKRNLYKEKDGWADGSNCDYSAHSESQHAVGPTFLGLWRITVSIFL